MRLPGPSLGLVPLAAVLLACPAPGRCPAFLPAPPGPVAVEVVGSEPVETGLGPEGAQATESAWVALIGRAQRSLDVAQFYVVSRPGSRLEPVVAALVAAARRGVRVRILSDRSMAAVSASLLRRLRGVPGIALAAFDGRRLAGGILHAKLIVADGRWAYVGSANLDWRSVTHIHETGLVVDSAAVAGALAHLFELDWRFARGQRRAHACGQRAAPSTFPPGLRLVASPPGHLPRGVGPAVGALVELLDGARTEIRIQLLTYALATEYSPVPFTTLDAALRRAVRRGVRVRMLVSDWNLDPGKIAGIRGLARVPGIEVRVVRFPEARAGYIPYARVHHSKVLRVDDRTSWVGTSNWSGSYFLASRNLELIVDDLAVARVLDARFEALWASGHAARLDPDRTYPIRKHD